MRQFPGDRATDASRTTRATVLAWAIAAIYAAIVLIGAQGDVSRLIVAGDRHVDAARVPAPIAVLPHSNGYDGQFYYRLALDPLPDRQTGKGVTLDRPAYRNQRIVYPLLAGALALGQPGRVPWALLLVNLLGLAIIARTAVALGRRLTLPPWFAPALLAWPGFLVTLSHDTTEIVAAAFLLLAIEAMAARRQRRFVAFAALCLLTRETAALLLLGMAVGEAWQAPSTGRLRRVGVILAPVALYALWRAGLWLHWRAIAQTIVAQPADIGWPLGGYLQTLRDSVLLARPLSPRPGPNLVRNIHAFAGALTIGLVALGAGRHLADAWRERGLAMVLAVGWVVLALALSTLTAQGPWVDPTAFFRAFTEFWIASLLLLGLTGARMPRPVAVLAALGWIATMALAL